MKRGLLVFLAMCAFAVAMVPRERRAVNTEEEEEAIGSSSTPATTKVNVCAPQTPCSWTIYQPHTKKAELFLVNEYCVCADDMKCQYHEDDSTASAFIFRCRPPGAAENKDS